MKKREKEKKSKCFKEKSQTFPTKSHRTIYPQTHKDFKNYTVTLQWRWTKENAINNNKQEVILLAYNTYVYHYTAFIYATYYV